jgi:hypothetical protein
MSYDSMRRRVAVNLGVTPWSDLTIDLQVINPAEVENDTAIVVGLPVNLSL